MLNVRLNLPVGWDEQTRTYEIVALLPAVPAIPSLVEIYLPGGATMTARVQEVVYALYPSGDQPWKVTPLVYLAKCNPGAEVGPSLEAAGWKALPQE
jgi:hypothetical protein